MTKTALITGINGQDGAYLAHYLITECDYKVYGLVRRNRELWRLDELFENTGKYPEIVYGDVTENMLDLINKIKPDEIYNLAAQSHVGYSFKNPHLTMDINYGGLVNIIEAVKQLGLKTRIYQASTSELFGYNKGEKLHEDSLLQPRSPYAIAKLAAHWAGINARKEGVFVANGILFNHESPLRGEDFVTKKITQGVARIIKDSDFILELGNLDACRDWGYAGDYVRAMHAVLQYKEPEDFVIGTGETYSVREFLSGVLEVAGIHCTVKGEGVNEVWYHDNRPIVKINPEFYRPNDVEVLIADARKAQHLLGWQPVVSFEQLVECMTRYDKEKIR